MTRLRRYLAEGKMRCARRGSVQLSEYALVMGLVASAAFVTQALVSRAVAGVLTAKSNQILGTSHPKVDEQSSTSESNVTVQADAARIKTFIKSTSTTTRTTGSE